MKDKRNNTQCYEDEIDIRELIMSLWKHKIFIICITLLISILAGIYSKFFLTPVYNTKLNIVISMPETYTTRYGEYVLPITSNDQYIDLITSNDVLINTIRDMDYNTDEMSVEDLSRLIKINKSSTTGNLVRNSFEITVSEDSPSKSYKLAQTLFNNYTKFLDAMTKERAISYFSNSFIVQIKSFENQLSVEKEILSNYEELLENTPQTFENGNANIEIQDELTSSSKYVVPVGIVNPNYIKIENDIVNSKQSIIGLESSIKLYNQYLNELDIEMQAVNKYYETGQVETLGTSVIGVVETSVYLPSPPVEPTQKSSPSNLKLIFIGAVIGMVVGILGSFVKEYWFRKV